MIVQILIMFRTKPVRDRYRNRYRKIEKRPPTWQASLLNQQNFQEHISWTNKHLKLFQFFFIIKLVFIKMNKDIELKWMCTFHPILTSRIRRNKKC